MQEPKLMDFSRMRDIIEPHVTQLRKHIFINRELAVLYGVPEVFRLIAQQKPPFTFNDHRLGVITRGEVHANINLVEKHLTAGMLVFIGPGSIISPVSFSPDLEIFGVGLSSAFPMPFTVEQMPSAFNGQVRDFQLPVSENDLLTARHIVDTLWHVVHQPSYSQQTMIALVAAMMHHYDELFRRQVDLQKQTQSRNQTIFDRFIYLVNQNVSCQRRIGFYAEKMCLTERYLGTVIRHTSGVTAKEWIDRALVTRIQVELRHTDKTIVQIADEMDFPNPSFFCKYFKRMTGMTAQAYRNS